MVDRAKGKASSKDKGDIVEKIVEMMHRSPELKVLRDQQLPAADGSNRTRQFDVLVLGTFAGYESMLVIECKNYKRNINVKDVDSFYGELQDVGYGPREGVLVSAGKIGAGAQSRARSLGLKVFELKGLTTDRLSSAVHEARQRLVFAIPEISHLAITSSAGGSLEVHETWAFFNEDGGYAGSLADLVWEAWLHGVPPSVMGEHELELDTTGWYHGVQGERVPVMSATAKIRIKGAVVALPGSVTRHALVEPGSTGAGRLQKFKANARFDVAPGQYPVRSFETEKELERFLNDDRAIMSLTVGRVRAPRLRLENVFWPPSQRVLEKMREMHEAYESGEGPPPNPDALRGIEGTELNVLWEPVSPEYVTVGEPEKTDDHG